MTSLRPPATWFAALVAGLVLAPDSSVAADDRAAGPVMTLAQAVDKALGNQPNLRIARANTEAAQGRVEQARAPGLPQVTATGAYQRTTGNFAPRPGATTVTQTPPWSSTTYDFFNFGITASQLIYDFGQTPGRRRAAEANREATRASEKLTELQVVANVHRAYYETLAQQELVKVARDAVANQEKHLAQVQGLVGAGLRPDIDLARVRTDLANARVQLITAENGVALGRAQLDQAMGVPGASSAAGGYSLVDAPQVPVPGEAGSTDALVRSALATRPELVSLHRARQAQEASIKGLRGSYAPALGATAGATEAGTGLDRLVPNWMVGATLTWPLLQGGLTQGQLREAHAVLSGLDAQAEAGRLQVRVEVEQSQLAVRAAQASGVAAAEALAGAQELLRLAEGRYSAGLGNVIELGDAQLASTNAAAQAVQARYNLATARAQLLAALGRR
jgi:outer membrane protein